MTHLSNGTVATDLDAHEDNATLSAQGYTIRQIETYHRDTDMSCIVWDAPTILPKQTCPSDRPNDKGPAHTGRPVRRVQTSARLAQVGTILRRGTHPDAKPGRAGRRPQRGSTSAATRPRPRMHAC